MITEIRQQSNSVLTYSSLFPAHRCPSTIKFKIRLQNARAWIDQTSFQFLRLTFWQIKWTECKKWKRNSEKFNFWLNLFLWFRINYSWNWECFDQSCVNRTETVHGTLRFLYLSHPLYGICVKIFIMNRYISKSYTATKNTVDLQYTERGSCSVNYY